MAELVTNLSTADISAERLTESVTRFLKDRYPVSDGYDHTVKTFVPFKELPKLQGHRLWVRRGVLWGYRVEVVPTDSQCRSVRVQLTRFTPLNEIFALCSIVPAFLLIVGLQIFVVGNWGAWKDYRDPVLVLLLPSFALGLTLFGLLQLLSWPFVAKRTDKRQITEETAILRQSLHDALVDGGTPKMRTPQPRNDAGRRAA